MNRSPQITAPPHLVANFRVRVLYNKCVYILRSLHSPSKLSVVKNQEVSPPDVLGVAEINPGFSVINICRELKISPVEAMKALQQPIGKPVYKGELLVQKKSLFGRKNIVSPTDCIIDRFDPQTGDLLLKMIPKQVSLISGVYGIVHNVDPLKGEVLIKTMATEVWGICGSGYERSGFLKVIGKSGNLINESQITPDLRGQIVLGGSMLFGAALKKATEYQVAGIITGGLNLDDYVSIAASVYEKNKSHSDIGMSLVAIEGFGPIPIAEDAYINMVTYVDKFIFINGNSGKILLPNSSADSIIAARKTELPPIVAPTPAPVLKAVEVKVGALARIIWPPFIGVQGRVSAVDQTPTYLDSGILTYGVILDTPSRKIKVPYSNLEIIG